MRGLGALSVQPPRTVKPYWKIDLYNALYAVHISSSGKIYDNMLSITQIQQKIPGVPDVWNGGAETPEYDVISASCAVTIIIIILIIYDHYCTAYIMCAHRARDDPIGRLRSCPPALGTRPIHLLLRCYP